MMSQLTYEQIVCAIVELPLLAKQQLLSLLLAQPGVSNRPVNHDLPASLFSDTDSSYGQQFEQQWIAALRQNPDEADRAQDWLDAQTWSEL